MGKVEINCPDKCSLCLCKCGRKNSMNVRVRRNFPVVDRENGVLVHFKDSFRGAITGIYLNK